MAMSCLSLEESGDTPEPSQATRLRPHPNCRPGPDRAFLKALATALADVDAALPVRTGRATSDIVRSYLGLLVQRPVIQEGKFRRIRSR